MKQQDFYDVIRGITMKIKNISYNFILFYIGLYSLYKIFLNNKKLSKEIYEFFEYIFYSMAIFIISLILFIQIRY